MKLLSDKDILGLIDHLCFASITPLSCNKQRKLYWLMNTAVSHLETIQDDDRILNIRENLLQNLAQRDPDTLQKLSTWLSTHSIKKTNGELCGAIVPFQKLFCSITKPEETTQRLIQGPPAPFSIVNYVNDVCETITPNHPLEDIMNAIFSLLNRWQDAAKNQSEAMDKKELIEDTYVLINTIKEMEKNQFNIFSLIVLQKTEEFNKYPWNKIASSEAENFPLLSELMELIFDTHLPKTYNKSGVTSFFDLIRRTTDVRKTQFVEADVLKKLYAVSSRDHENAINDSIEQINRGTLSNLSLNLNSISSLKAFFGEHNYKKLTRLEFKNESSSIANQKENITPAENLLESLSQDFPNLTHLSLDSYIFNSAAEHHLGTLKELQSLKLIASNNSNQFNFLKELKKLQELQLTVSEKGDLTNLLTLLKLKKLNIWLIGKGNLDVLEKLTWLEDLNLTTTIEDISFLKHLKTIKNLKVNGLFKKLHLEDLPSLSTLTIESCPCVISLNLSKLPLLEKLSLKGTSTVNFTMDDLPNLIELDLGFCLINTGDLENSTKLSKLTFRHLFLFSKCNWLFKYPIQSLNVSNSKISRLSILDRLPYLTELNLTNCKKISNTELNAVLNYPSLKTLFIDDRELPEKFKEDLQKQNITLKITTSK